MVKANALFAEIIPFGISRIAVRGFFASKFLSRYRLKHIAALRAKIMQRMTSTNRKTKRDKKLKGNLSSGHDDSILNEVVVLLFVLNIA